MEAAVTAGDGAGGAVPSDAGPGGQEAGGRSQEGRQAPRAGLLRRKVAWGAKAEKVLPAP